MGLFLSLCAATLLLLAALETSFNKGRYRYSLLFLNVLAAIAFSCVPLAMIGTAFAIGVRPFWLPREFIPVIGMLFGNCMSAVALGVHHTLSYYSDNRDKLEWSLSLGATRWEACALPSIACMSCHVAVYSCMLSLSLPLSY